MIGNRSRNIACTKDLQKKKQCNFDKRIELKKKEIQSK